MLCDKTKIENILVVSLSNIGDVILTFPVIDVLRHDFPGSKISIVIGPKAQSLLVGNPNFSQIFIYDKHQSVLGKIRFVRELQMKKFDLIVICEIPRFLFLSQRNIERLLRKRNQWDCI